ncbi:hypothetical protein PL321_13965 [Caloramator sp. mosi_1]|uniref:hypothetical protein n=1 Tax=Caloramator sp. mosi_1 TaxID=3023090 RepID=UPI00236245E1|nr:hypothetical protein [Caloramator sp. mosi_1]WDC83679.1 hypothetical protein PL321_13965 [Caloramator sp. mosi_1]
MLVNELMVSCNGGYCKFYLCVYKNFEHINEGKNVLFIADVIGITNINSSQHYFVPVVVTEKHSVKITAIAGKNGVSGQGRFCFYLQPKAIKENFY